MDIENIWKQNNGSDIVLDKLLQKANFSNLHSKLPLRMLKKNLLIGIVYATLFTVFYVVLFFIVHIWQVHIAIAVGTVFNIVVGMDSWKLYKSVNENISLNNSLRNELEKNYYGFLRWWRIQEKLGLYVYPIAITGGFILGGVEGSGKSVEAFLYNPKILIVLGITLLLLVPACYYGSRWMYNYAYGKHLKKMKMLIEELSANE
jgi:hypothetical protein